MFDNSPNTKKILNYLEKKYCKSVAPIGVLKACAIVSALSKHKPRLSLLMIAPTRQFKSQTNEEMKKIFSPSYFIDLGSDFTIHGLHQKSKNYKDGLNKKCLMINDGTLLLSSKGSNTKSRLINGLAELLSDGKYIYMDNLNYWELKGDVTLIMNMTTESFYRNKSMITENTFVERMFSIHYSINEKEMNKILSDKRMNIETLYDEKKFSKMKDYELNSDLKNLREKIASIVKEFSILNFHSALGMHDLVESALKAHAVLNGRDKIMEDDFDFLKLIENYLIDPTAPNQHLIIKYYLDNKGYKKICELLGKEYDSYGKYVRDTIKKARYRGIIPMDFKIKIDDDNDDKLIVKEEKII